MRMLWPSSRRCRERVAEGMAGGALRDRRPLECVPHSALKHGFVQVVASALAGRTLDVDASGGEHPLPGPFPAGVRMLAREGRRQLHPPGAMAKIDLVLLLGQRQVPGQLRLHDGRQHRHPVLVPLAATDGELVPREVNVLHSKARAFEQTESRAVEERTHQTGHPVHLAEHRSNLLAGQHDGQPHRSLRTDHVVEPRQVLLENVSIRKRSAASAWFCVDAAALPSRASELRNVVISGAPISAGWRLSWKKM